MNYALNLIIVIYLFYAWSWNLPDNSPLKQIINPLSPIVRWLGLWHSWSMFAPQPIQVSRGIVVEYVLTDGTVQRKPEIRMQDLSIWQALLEAHERKYQDNLAGNDYKAHRLAMCNYAADRFEGDPKQLERVDLVLEKTRIPQPAADEGTDGSSCQRTVLWSVKFI